MMESIRVNLGERSYKIYIGSGVLEGFGKKYKEEISAKRAVVVTNPIVGKHYYGTICKSLEEFGIEVVRIDIPDGEQYKTLNWASKIFDKLIALKVDRQTPLIALGGGVIGDITGFVASTYLRGVPFIQVPTTLLAQVDSSVGGKTGVNHRKGKNLIGAFYQPKFVYIDINTLKTLKKRELRAGLAEVIKYGVIKDKNLFNYLEKNIAPIVVLDKDALIYIIKRSCAIKAVVVGADERESGLRAILNFGHTFGHAIEAATKYKRYKHGEAVAIGMVLAAEFSWNLGKCSKNVRQRIIGLIEKVNLPTLCTGISSRDMLKAVELDKKKGEDGLKYVFVEDIGGVTIQKVERVLYSKYLNDLERSDV